MLCFARVQGRWGIDFSFVGLPDSGRHNASTRGLPMNELLMEGRWKRMRSSAKLWWSKLTDKDLDGVHGQFDKLAIALQAKYGYTREQADAEIDRRVKEYDEEHDIQR